MRFLFLVPLLLAACATETHTSVTVLNPTSYPVRVSVGGDESSGWLHLGRVKPGEELHFGEVLDQGETWAFLFSYQGVEAEVEVDRNELSRGEPIEVPSSIQVELGREGVPTPP